MTESGFTAHEVPGGVEIRVGPAPDADVAEAAAVGRYEAALASGLSDYEAREEGWPSTVSPEVRLAGEGGSR